MEPNYKIESGTHYKPSTPDEVIRLLERSRHTGERIRIHYGDATTGRDWLEEWDVTGHIGRSMGPVKIPLMIATARSTGGPGILDDCIVKIRSTRGGAVLYQHPAYNAGRVTLRDEPGELYAFKVDRDGVTHAGFRTARERAAWVAKMGLTVTA